MKVLLKRRRHFFKLFTYEHVNIFIVVIVYMSLQENNSFLSFHSLMFHSKIHEHPACEMNRDEQGGAGQKSEVLGEHTF